MVTRSIAVLTASGASRNTSARCGVAQSTTVVVTAPVSTAGISVRQSPAFRSNQFFVCGAAGGGDDATLDGAVADSDAARCAPPPSFAAQADSSTSAASDAQNAAALLLGRIFEKLRRDFLCV